MKNNEVLEGTDIFNREQPMRERNWEEHPSGSKCKVIDATWPKTISAGFL